MRGHPDFIILGQVNYFPAEGSSSRNSLRFDK